MSSTVSLALPIGTGDPAEPPGTLKNQRPNIPYNNSGLLRYNTTLRALEVLQEGKWYALKTKTPAAIVQQKFIPRPAGNTSGVYVDGEEIHFGPLVGQNPDDPVVGPKNILVFIENVPQMAYDDYTIVESGTFTIRQGITYPDGLYLKFMGPVPANKTVYVLHGFD
jgi:hypothetical protein